MPLPPSGGLDPDPIDEELMPRPGAGMGMSGGEEEGRKASPACWRRPTSRTTRKKSPAWPRGAAPTRSTRSRP